MKTYNEVYKDIFSHIKNEAVRDYYIKNKADTYIPLNELAQFIYYGVYAISEKTSLLKSLISAYKEDQLILKMYPNDISDMNDAVNGYDIAIDNLTITTFRRHTRTRLYVIHPVNTTVHYNDFDYEFKSNIDDIVLYATNLSLVWYNIITIRNVHKDELYDYTRFYIDVVDTYNTNQYYRYVCDFTSYDAHPIISSYIICSPYTENKYNKLYEIISNIHSNIIETYGFKHRDKVSLQTPIMSDPIVGFFYDGDYPLPTDLSCPYYGISKDQNCEDACDNNLCIKYATGSLYPEFGYLLCDYITKLGGE